MYVGHLNRNAYCWTKKKLIGLGLKTYIICLRNILVREPAIGLIKWLRPKGLKVCSYIEKYAQFKNQTLTKSAGTQTCYLQRMIPGVTPITK